LDLKVRVIAEVQIERVEVIIDGLKRETLTTRPFESTLDLGSGAKTLKVKAYGEGGKTGESGEVRVGMGGVRWDIALITPTPSPQPTVIPTVVPTLAISASPEP
jgi:hypothetical protein